MSDTSQGPGWWQATDGKWYPPQGSPGEGYWMASDGNWYPPVEPAAAVGTPAPEAPAAYVAPPVSSAPPPAYTAPTAEVSTAAAPVVEAPHSAVVEAKASKKGLFITAAVFVVLMLVAAAILVAVNRGGGSDIGSGAGGGGGATPTSAGGSANAPNGPVAAGPDDLPDKSITLTDDTVVVRGNGGKTVKAVADNGATITLDGSAEGVDKLKEGSVMLLTGVTVVRVGTLEKSGNDVKISAEPVTLPEVIKDGDLNWDNRTVNPDDGHLVVDDGGSGGTDGSGTGDTTDTTDPTTGIDINGPLGAPRGGVAPAAEYGGEGESAAGAVRQPTVSAKVGTMKADITYEGSGGGHHLDLKLTSSGDVSGTLEVDVKLGSLAYSGGTKVAGGQVKNFDFSFENLGGSAVVSTDLKGLQNVAKVKLPPFFKLPFSVSFPAFVGGIPFTLTFSGTIEVTVSMALANSSLSGKAEITYDGDAGFHFKDGSASLDGKRTQDVKDPLALLKGLSPGPVGAVITAELPKVGFGFMFLQTGAGIYISNGMVVSQAILPMPAQCTASNIAYVLAGGVEAKFLGKGFDIARKAFVKKEWNFQVPKDTRCNQPK